MIVEARPVRVGKLAFRLRWAKDRSLTFTAVAASDLLTLAANNLVTGDSVWVVSANLLPTPLIPNTKYFYININNTTGKLATTKANAIAGTAIDLTDAGTGVHTIMFASGEAAADYGPLVVRASIPGDKANRAARLNKAGIDKKVDSAADTTDNSDDVPIDGDELSIVFDNDTANQTALGNRTVMVIPTEPDLGYLWQVDNVFRDRKSISQEDFGELGRYLLKKCR